jgi:Domain of unknown function (DUF397)
MKPQPSLLKAVSREENAVANLDQSEAWIRSTKCDTGSCLEAQVHDDRVVIRNSTDPDGQRLSVSGARWGAFMDDLKSRVTAAR